MAAAEAWQTGHEKGCEQRQAALGREIRDLKKAMGSLNKGAWGVVLALLGWAAVQLYQVKTEHREPPPAYANQPGTAH